MSHRDNRLAGWAIVVFGIAAIMFVVFSVGLVAACAIGANTFLWEPPEICA